MGRRRRSATVAISVLGLSAAVTGCDSGPDPKVYRTVDECAVDHPAAACQGAWQASVGEQAASAPQFNQSDSCEQQYGAGHCMPYTGASGQVFIPMMAGFVIGRALAKGRDDAPSGGGASGGWGSGGGYFGHPVFFNSTGGYATTAARPGEALYTRSAGFTERAGFGLPGGFSFGGRGG